MSDQLQINASRLTRVWTGLVSLAQGFLLLVPTFVLGAAIEWPASLDDPASIALPRLLEEESGVRLGYAVYLIYSILFVITIALIARLNKVNAAKTLIGLAIAFAAISTLARSVGIIRWLAPMPQLAEQWQLATTDQERFSISVVYEQLNSFGGTIGEILGVSLFAAISIFLLSIAAWKDRFLPKWLSVFGVIASIGLISAATELLGSEPGDLILVGGTTLAQFWFMATGFWLLLRAGRGTQNLAKTKA